MRGVSLEGLALWVSGLIALLAVTLLFLDLVRAEPYQLPVSFSSSVNGSVANSSLNITTPSGSFNYTLTNVSQTFSLPLTFTSNVTFFNVSVNESATCSLVNDTFWNVTYYFESLVRERLVPSQQQYQAVFDKGVNDSAQCEIDKQKLRNEILKVQYEANNTFVSFNATTTILHNTISDLRNENKLYLWLVISLLIYGTLITILVSRGISFATFWDWLANMRMFSPVKYRTGGNREDEKKDEGGK